MADTTSASRGQFLHIFEGTLPWFQWYNWRNKIDFVVGKNLQMPPENAAAFIKCCERHLRFILQGKALFKISYSNLKPKIQRELPIVTAWSNSSPSSFIETRERQKQPLQSPYSGYQLTRLLDQAWVETIFAKFHSSWLKWKQRRSSTLETRVFRSCGFLSWSFWSLITTLRGLVCLLIFFSRKEINCLLLAKIQQVVKLYREQITNDITNEPETVLVYVIDLLQMSFTLQGNLFNYRPFVQIQI